MKLVKLPVFYEGENTELYREAGIPLSTSDLNNEFVIINLDTVTMVQTSLDNGLWIQNENGVAMPVTITIDDFKELVEHVYSKDMNGMPKFLSTNFTAKKSAILPIFPEGPDASVLSEIDAPDTKGYVCDVHTEEDEDVEYEEFPKSHEYDEHGMFDVDRVDPSLLVTVPIMVNISKISSISPLNATQSNIRLSSSAGVTIPVNIGMDELYRILPLVAGIGGPAEHFK